ncbi:MFS transporter [Plantactinospora sp. KLBMP9567]|uniref:MFS transporter n=1 Tax=Plantactinospora sp. KLBMP9567 TaxID=3085900 RepID=UPI002981E43A|nr:MFS transporter [Plantactinospora sp. KLBMP9567]MDW5326752.1 MFS transporter [Plantactinospora sp. KLBMP9567]
MKLKSVLGISDNQVLHFKDVLRLPGAKKLVLAGLVGQMPIGMVTLPVTLAVVNVTSSYSSAGLALFTYMAGIGVTSPVWGRSIDRFGGGLVLKFMSIAFVLMSTLLTLTIIASAHYYLIIAATAAVGATRPALMGAMQSLWTAMTPDEKTRNAAYSLHAQELGIVWVTGPLVVTGALVVFGEQLGPLIAILAAGLLGGIGAVLVAQVWATQDSRIHSVSASGAPGDPDNAVRKPQRLYTRAYIIFLVSVSLFEMAVGAGIFSLTAYAERSGAPAIAGFLVAALFVGCIVGGFRSGAKGGKPPAANRYRLGLIALAGSFAVLAAMSNPFIIAILLILGGMVLAETFTAQYAVTAILAPPSVRAEGFSWLGTLAALGGALGSALAGFAIGQYHHSSAGLLVASASAALGGLIFFHRRPRLSHIGDTKDEPTLHTREGTDS